MSYLNNSHTTGGVGPSYNVGKKKKENINERHALDATAYLDILFLMKYISFFLLDGNPLVGSVNNN